MQIHTGLDWITAVRNGQYPEIIIPHENIEMGLRQKNPTAWYAATYALIPGGKFSSRTSEGIDQGMLQLTGDDMAQWRKAGWGDNRIMQFLHDKDAHYTRLDFAVDVFDTVAHPSELVDLFDAGEHGGSVRSISHFDAREKGYTAYFGSRSSDQFVRVYDKAAERKLSGMLWTRIEIQTRKKRAELLGGDMHRATIADAGKSKIKKLIDFPGVEWWRKALCTKTDVKHRSLPRKQPDALAWLENQVASIFRTSHN